MRTSGRKGLHDGKGVFALAVAAGVLLGIGGAPEAQKPMPDTPAMQPAPASKEPPPDEDGAIATLKTIVTAEEQFKATAGTAVYAPLATLSATLPPYVDRETGSARRHGYSFLLVVGTPADSNYYVVASPIPPTRKPPPEPAAPIPEERLQQWVRDLGHDDFSVREAAADELRRAGKAARPALEAAARSTDAEVRARAEGLLEELAEAERPIPQGRFFFVDSSGVIRVRADGQAASSGDSPFE